MISREKLETKAVSEIAVHGFQNRANIPGLQGLVGDWAGFHWRQPALLHTVSEAQLTQSVLTTASMQGGPENQRNCLSRSRFAPSCYYTVIYAVVFRKPLKYEPRWSAGKGRAHCKERDTIKSLCSCWDCTERTPSETTDLVGGWGTKW